MSSGSGGSGGSGRGHGPVAPMSLPADAAAAAQTKDRPVTAIAAAASSSPSGGSAPPAAAAAAVKGSSSSLSSNKPSTLGQLMRSNNSSSVNSTSAVASSTGPPRRGASFRSNGGRLSASSEKDSSATSESDLEPVSPGSAASSNGNSRAGGGKSGRSSSRTGSSSSATAAAPSKKRSVYAQKLIHLSNTVRSLFASATSSASLSLSAGSATLGFGATQSPHCFTNSPAWILGCVYKLLGPLPPTPMGTEATAISSVNMALAANLHGYMPPSAGAGAGAIGALSGSAAASPHAHTMSSLLAAKRARFLSDFHSKLWLTYRRGFAQIGQSSYTSDAGWGCFASGTPVAMADGTSRAIESVTVGSRVLALGDRGLVARTVTAVTSTGQRPCVELRFSDGRTVICTPDHRLLTTSGVWTAAGDLTVGTSAVCAAARDRAGSLASMQVDASGGTRYAVPRGAKSLPLFRVTLVGRREVGLRHTWDLTVPQGASEAEAEVFGSVVADMASFCANGIVAHNCMIRSAQMLLAQTFVRHSLGRDWRRPTRNTAMTAAQQQSTSPSGSPASSPSTSPVHAGLPGSSSSPPAASYSDLPPLPAAYLRILSMFLDSPSPSCPYSIHNLLLAGGGGGGAASAVGKGKPSVSSPSSSTFSPGCWFGPHNACWMIKSTMEAELAKLEARIAAGRAPATMAEMEAEGLFGGQGGSNCFQAGDNVGEACSSNGNSVLPSAAAGVSASSSSSLGIPSRFSIPKIYVSDDGTLYLDKLLKLAKGDDYVVPPPRQRPTPSPSPSPSPDPSSTAASAAAAASTAAAAAAASPLPQPVTPAASSVDADDTLSNDEPAVSASPAAGASTPATAAAANPSPLPPPLQSPPPVSPSPSPPVGAATASSSSSVGAGGLPVFTPDFHPLLILIPLRLGVDKLNAAYIPSLLSLFQFPQCVGIIGGKPRSSLYFIGVQDEHLFYLDPHTVQRAWDLTGRDSLRNPSLVTRHAISDSYHCQTVQSIHVTAIDPSLALGFYIENENALEQFWEQARQFSDAATLQAAAVAAGLAPEGSSPSPSPSPSPSSASSSRSSSRPGRRGSPRPALVLHSVFHVCDAAPNYDFDGAESDDEGDEDEDDEEEDAEEEYEDGAAAINSLLLTDDVEPETEEALESARRAARDDNRSESPVAVSTLSLPTDAQGRPLTQDSLTSSPVLCPRIGEPQATGNGTPTSLDLGPSVSDGDAAAPAGPSAVSSAAAATAAKLSGLGHAASGWMAAVASTAQQQFAAAQQHLAQSAAQLQAAATAAAAAAAASAHRATAGGEEQQQQPLPPVEIPLVCFAASLSPTAAAAASHAAVVTPSSRSPASSSRAGPAASSSLSSPAGAAAAASVSSPAAAASKPHGKSSAKSRARARRGRHSAAADRDHAGSDEDDFVVL